MRGPGPDVHSFPLPAATDGFIKDGSYTYAGDSIVYAVQQLRGTVQRIGTVGRFRQSRYGAETTLAMAITPNDKIIADMVQLAVTRSMWELTLRRDNGAFEPVARGAFRPILTFDRDYRFEFEATDSAVTVKVPGAEVTKQVSTAGLLGDRAFWEEYRDTKGPKTGVVFDFDNVWAAEEGQPLLPVETLQP
jgi:hypothetical protein